jgi:rhamnose transport system permease protein
MTATAQANSGDAQAASARGFLHRYLREISVAIAYLLLLALLAVSHPAFFHAGFRETWVSAAPVLVAAVGMTLVIIAREIDISIGSQFSACGIIAGMLAQSKLPIPVVLLCTVAAGGAMGAINGGLVAGLRLPSIVVTLATMVIIRGVLLWATEGAAVLFPPSFQWLGASQAMGQAAIVLIALVVFAGFAWALRWLAAGRAVYAVGSDAEAARLAGIRPRRVVFWVFVLMGMLSGLASLLNASQFVMIYPNTGDGLELAVIAAVVVGGTAISGGRGNLIGTLLGVALLTTIGPALVFVHAHVSALGSQWAKAIQGLVILAAVSSDALARRTR